MSDKSAIEWTQATLNPWTGCSKVSPGCARCYIPRTMPFRTAGRTFDEHGHIPLVFHMERLGRMLRRRKPTVYFVNSLSDLFHEDASDGQIARVFAAMAAAPQHTFQVLTKRPERMAPLLSDAGFVEMVHNPDNLSELFPEPWPLPNVWLGVSIENRRFVDRADLLRATPAAVRFISAEPLLGPLVPTRSSERRWRGEGPGDGSRAYGSTVESNVGTGRSTQAVADGTVTANREAGRSPRLHPEGLSLDLTGIDWLICGGESGKGARRMDLQWARDLRDACSLAATAFFVKQLGGPRPGTALEDLPEDLRIREMPSARPEVAPR